MSSKPKLIITCGKAFSGKSTIAKQLSKKIPTVRLSYDEIWVERRASLESDQDSLLEYDQIMSWMIQESFEVLKSGQSVIIDTLFDTRDSRQQMRKLFGDEGFTVITIYCKISDTVQKQRIAQNRSRPTRHQVDPEQIKIYNAKFEIPDGEEGLVVFDFG